MDFAFSPEQEHFRDEVRAFLSKRLPEDWDFRDFVGDMRREERSEVAQAVDRALAERRWLALPWAEELGGLGAGHVLQAIFTDETAYARMPGGSRTGVTSVGPVLQQWGTEGQRQRWLPRIARGEDTWCTLFTEPGAGSDLAGIETRARREGDEFVVNGVKVFVRGAREADMGWLAARTDPDAPRHRGISIFALPMDTPGVSVRPMVDLAGGDDLGEVFLDDVHVPAEHLVGDEHHGWDALSATLDLERSGVETFATGKRNIERLVEAAKDDASLISRNPNARLELADRWIELQVGYSVAYRVPLLQQEGLLPLHEASISKLYGSELSQRIAGTGMHLLGAAGQLDAGSRYARLGGAFSRLYLRSTAETIEGGTSEVQRNLIAQRGLGLPRA